MFREREREWRADRQQKIEYIREIVRDVERGNGSIIESSKE